jgi:uncharacterized protein (TIGR02996 family)
LFYSLEMPTDAEPFLQRIRAFPDEDSHRLIYADWLEEQGDRPRAAFIRIQIALAALPEDNHRRIGLLASERELLDGHMRDWKAPFSGLADGPEFRRGFVEEVNVSARQFLARADELFAAGPIRHVHLLDIGNNLESVLQSPFLGRLTALTVFAQHAGESLARGIARCPHLSGLQQLHLRRNRLEDGAAEQLAASPFLTNLEELDLSENNLTESGARAIAGSSNLSNLRRLELSHNPLGPGGAGLLAGSDRLDSLERLGLGNTDIGVPRLHGLPGVSGLLRIATLDLTGNRLGPNGIRTILTRPAADRERPIRLRELDLSHNELGETGTRILAQCPALAGVTVLRLAACGLTDSATPLLADSQHLSGLTLLDLANNPINDPGFRCFLEPSCFRSLRRLIYPLGISPFMKNRLDDRFHRAL